MTSSHITPQQSSHMLSIFAINWFFRKFGSPDPDQSRAKSPIENLSCSKRNE